MSEEKIKVSELPEQEQKELIAKAYAVGLKGVFNSWNVETLKNKIAEKEGKSNDKQNTTTEERNGSDVNTEETPADETKAEETKEEKPQKTAKKDKTIPGEKLPKAKETKKVNGICHICGSRVENGVCTGCGFSR